MFKPYKGAKVSYTAWPMENESSQTPARPSGGVKSDLLLELNFVPEWARKAPGPNPYVGHTVRDREERRGGGGRKQRQGRDSRRGERQGRDSRGDRQGRGSRRSDSRGGRSGREETRRPARAREIGLQVGFLADREHLSSLAREIKRSEKAYPIIEVASMMMRLPEHYLVKLETVAGKDRPATDLFQCKACQMVFLKQVELEQHISQRHLDTVFDVEEVEGEPPSGKFVCVGRCKVTGTLLGPPNYHGYNQKIQELIQSRFPNLSVAQYRDKVEMVHDEEVIEQWRQESCRQTIYRRKRKSDSDEEQPIVSREKARREFMESHAPRLVQKTHRALLPAAVAQHITDVSLLDPIRLAWGKESRFPLSMALAMRPGFRHMHLHLFKANQKAVFVTSIQPKPLDPAHAVSEIADVLRYLHDHPGCHREAMLHDLYPEATEESPEAVELNGRLRWLIERGHVIHFYNGALSVPTSANRADTRNPQRSNKRRPRKRRPVDGGATGNRPPSDNPAEKAQ